MTKSILALAFTLGSLSLSACAAPDVEAEDTTAQSEDEFSAGDYYVVRNPFVVQDIDRRPAPKDAGDARCFAPNPPSTLACKNPPLPQKNLGQGQLLVKTLETRTWHDETVVDLEVRHPSFDGTRTITRRFRNVPLRNEGVSYNLSEWQQVDELTSGARSYQITFTFLNDGFIRDVRPEKIIRAQVVIENANQFMVLKYAKR